MQRLLISAVLLLCAASGNATPVPPRDVQDFSVLKHGIDTFLKETGRPPLQADWYPSIRPYVQHDLLPTFDPKRFQYQIRDNGGQLQYTLIGHGNDGVFGTKDDIDVEYVSRLYESMEEAGRTMAEAPLRAKRARRRIMRWCVAGLSALVIGAAIVFRVWRRRRTETQPVRGSGG
jgi:hypothetical protein